MRRVGELRGYSYAVVDLPYRAVSVAKFETLLATYISAGKYYEFGESVSDGVNKLWARYRFIANACPQTKWVLAGYSQGAMVVSEAVTVFRPEDVVYVGLFGDPELSLPEGKGFWPDACRGRNYSSWRVYAPSCRTKAGALGEREPYEAPGLEGKFGLWCNKNDYICGSSANPLKNGGHMSYEDFALLWMSKNVSKRLPQNAAIDRIPESGESKTKKALTTLVAEPTASVFAVLPTDTYYVSAGESVEFDAADSFSLESEIVRYEWRRDGVWTDGTERYRASFQGDELLTLRVTDAAGRVAERTVSVIISAPPQSEMVPPRVELLRHEDGSLTVRALERPSWASYLLVRLNGFDLGYAAADEELTVADLRYTADEVLSFAWVDADYEVGEEFVVRAEALPIEESTVSDQGEEPAAAAAGEQGRPEDLPSAGTVKTGIDDDFFSWAVVGVIVGMAALLLWRLRARKNAHRGGDERQTG